METKAVMEERQKAVNGITARKRRVEGRRNSKVMEWWKKEKS